VVPVYALFGGGDLWRALFFLPPSTQVRLLRVVCSNQSPNNSLL